MMNTNVRQPFNAAQLEILSAMAQLNSDEDLLELRRTLSKFFAETLAKKLSEDYDNLEYVSICVNEGIGQGAVYRKDL